MSAKRELFGGAITATLPNRLIDASCVPHRPLVACQLTSSTLQRVLRQVPDTQEVFLYPDSPASIILEILEKVDVADAKDAARYDESSTSSDAFMNDLINSLPCSPSAIPAHWPDIGVYIRASDHTNAHTQIVKRHSPVVQLSRVIRTTTQAPSSSRKPRQRRL